VHNRSWVWRLKWLGLVWVLGAPGLVASVSYDIVLMGGRVMDPETGLDAVRNVGIRHDRIVEISAEPLTADKIALTCTRTASRIRHTSTRRAMGSPPRWS
jgi:hypothetical protein